MRSILLRRSQHLSRIISSLIWERESNAFHDMMIFVKNIALFFIKYKKNIKSIRECFKLFDMIVMLEWSDINLTTI
jgi:hypothetical protein